VEAILRLGSDQDGPHLELAGPTELRERITGHVATQQKHDAAARDRMSGRNPGLIAAMGR